MLAEVVDCSRSREPRNALDQLILAWERGDRRWFEATLGQRARGALRTLLKRRSWPKMRTEIWRIRPGERVAVGYRFKEAGRWGEPRETLETGFAVSDLDQTSPKIETLFKTSNGRDCGKHRVEFVRPLPGKWEPPLAYLVDDPDLDDLLRTITRCATEGMVATPDREPR
jgi:hypothetical protein